MARARQSTHIEGIQDLADALLVGDDPVLLELALRLTRLSRLNLAALEDATASVGLTTAEAVVLTALVAAGPPHVLSPTALNGAVVQSPGGVTKTLRRLEAAGLVARRPDPADRRALHVELTAAGLQRAREVTATTTAHYGSLVEGIAAGDIDAFSTTVARLLERLARQLGYRSSHSLRVDATGRA